MLVKEISEQHIQDIGHAFGYYDYGEEKGMASWFRDKEAVVTYICGFVRCVLTDGFLHTTSERGEGYIAYKLPWQKVSFKAARILLRGMLQSMSLGELFHFARMLSKAGPSLEDVLNKEKKPCIYVGMVCVREAYQGRAICARSWILPLPKATGWAFPWCWTPMQNPSAISMSTWA